MIVNKTTLDNFKFIKKNLKTVITLAWYLHDLFCIPGSVYKQKNKRLRKDRYIMFVFTCITCDFGRIVNNYKFTHLVQ